MLKNSRNNSMATVNGSLVGLKGLKFQNSHKVEEKLTITEIPEHQNY
jgi:hypothetical protein